MWPVFHSWTRCHMWVEFVVGSLLCSEGVFYGYSGFPLFSKTILLGVVKFGEAIDWESVFCPSLPRNAPMLVSGFLRLSRARYCSPPCWIA